jgi:phosphoglycolate phosphatase
MDCKGMIFDLDGTLLDTLEDLADAANTTLSHFGFPVHEVDAYRYFVGEGLKTLMQRIVPKQKADEKSLALYMEKFARIYRTTWNKRSAPYQGIPEMIAALSHAGLKLAVLSNKPHPFTKICVETFFPDNPFLYVYGQREGVPKKPDPAGAIELAAKMGLQTSQVIYVGDTATDMKTGNGAGMKCIGVEWGFRDRAELKKNDAWKIAVTPAEVVSYAI